MLSGMLLIGKKRTNYILQLNSSTMKSRIVQLSGFFCVTSDEATSILGTRGEGYVRKKANT